MSTTYVVAPGYEFNYPADPISLGIVKKAGGRSKLTPEDSAKVKTKIVKEGQDCSDMEKSVLDLYTSRGWVIKEDSKISEEVWKDLGRPEKDDA